MAKSQEKNLGRVLTICDDMGERKMLVTSHIENGVETKIYQPVLEDKTSSGKVRPWAEKKTNNELVASLYRTLSLCDGDYYGAKADRLNDCASWLTFDVCDDNSLKLAHMNSCRVRLCPVCAWRRTLKIGSHARKIFTHVETAEEFKDKYTYLFLTLTIPNCSGGALSDTIDLLFNAWEKFTSRREFKKIIKGWYRGLEVTHNHNVDSKSYDTYHPHYHVILLVDKSYFANKSSGRGYITHEKWRMMWAESLGYFVTKNRNNRNSVFVKRTKPTILTRRRTLTVNEQKQLIKKYSVKNNGLCDAEKLYMINKIPKMKKLAVNNCLSPESWLLYHGYDNRMLTTANRLMIQVDIRAVRPKDKNINSDNPLERSGLISAVCEITKYTVKDKDYIIPWNWELSTDVVAVLDDALDRRRLVAWGGLLAKIRNKLKLDDEIDGDLIHIDDDDNTTVKDTLQVNAFWSTGYQQYLIHSVQLKSLS